MNVILLAGSEADAKRWTDAHPDAVVTTEPVAGARIVRLDRWQYNERTVSALRSLNDSCQFVDPTGLLGGSDYGAQRRDTHPVDRGVNVAVKTKRQRGLGGTPSWHDMFTS